jgi:hypothetical protein
MNWLKLILKMCLFLSPFCIWIKVHYEVEREQKRSNLDPNSLEMLKIQKQIGIKYIIIFIFIMYLYVLLTDAFVKLR